VEWQQRLERLGGVFDGLRDVWKPRLEVLIQKFGDRVSATPTFTPSTRSVELAFKTDAARIRLRFQGTTDHDIRKVILNYDLEIIPILMQFDSHAEFEMPLDAVDPAAVANWIDERILSFIKTYVSVHESRYYLKDQMVQDPVTGTEFPRPAAGATLERGGRTYYFVSEDTRREFEKRDAGKTS
jgi:YHS domain-containing protein